MYMYAYKINCNILITVSDCNEYNKFIIMRVLWRHTIRMSFAFGRMKIWRSFDVISVTCDLEEGGYPISHHTCTCTHVICLELNEDFNHNFRWARGFAPPAPFLAWFPQIMTYLFQGLFKDFWGTFSRTFQGLFFVLSNIHSQKKLSTMDFSNKTYREHLILSLPENGG